VLSIADLADRRTAEPGLDERGQPVDPLVVVDLDSATSDVERAVEAARLVAGRSAILVGIAQGPIGAPVDALVDQLDVVVGRGPRGDRRVVAVDPDAALAAIGGVIATAPLAAVTLTGLLRATAALPVESGLLAESFAYSMLLAGPEFARWRSEQVAREAPTAEGPVVRVAREGARLAIVLDRPERRNAFGRRLRDELVEALTMVDLDPSIGQVELRGEGPAFCSGGDLDEFGTSPDPVTAHVTRVSRSAALLLHRNATRVHAHLHGACIGAGIELPAFAGRVTAAPDTVARLPEVSMGLVPGAGGTVSIPRRIGRWRTAYLALSGCALDATTALAWGLVDEVSTGS
jgi:hypothetical protein